MKKLLALLFFISGGAFASSEQALQVRSEKHDVIVCAGQTNTPGYCVDVHTRDGYRSMTPAQYAGYSGYQFIHKQYVVVSANLHRFFIVMEVSKTPKAK